LTMTDEDEISDLLRRWRHATSEGDVTQLLPLMAEDVVFLSTGQPALCGREAFEAHFLAAMTTVRLQPIGELREIVVSGTFAYCWNDVVLHVVPRDAAPPLQLVGADLTILRKEPTGRWVVVRGASMLVPQQQPG
jgi:uncharacterized protein (TIGR02246 family)